jgi:mannose-6-phosphate isomerase-like protein (cupin superfamily)
MTELIAKPILLEAAGVPTKLISEFFGRLASDNNEVSVAVMNSPAGWSEPGQRPEFDEYSVVIDGEILVESESGSLTVSAGQAVHAAAGEWVRYSTPAEGGARYVSVCIPAFSPGTVHRDEQAQQSRRT